ncbi:MAG: Nif3-like dinuclear metal center hexameric protein [Ruminococcaceae bacterium]|nr:Nif3-like dinuclear metal center hexameric protein [Oscillospiraceae bacterium]
MKIKELYAFLDMKIPRSLSCPWDNDGLMCCPDGNAEVKKVLVTLDITDEAIDKATKEGCQLIVSHHPLIFKGLKAVSEEGAVSARTIKLIKNSLSAFSFHTRLDALSGGVNDILAGRLGVEDTAPFGVDGEEIGRIGTLASPCSAEEFAERVKNTLGAPSVALADAGMTVRRVAVLGGSGSDDVAAARVAGADTFVSGEISYHHMADAPEEGMNLIAAGHFFTEFPVCQRLAELIREADPEIECEIFFNNKVKYI